LASFVSLDATRVFTALYAAFRYFPGRCVVSRGGVRSRPSSSKFFSRTSATIPVSIHLWLPRRAPRGRATPFPKYGEADAYGHRKKVGQSAHVLGEEIQRRTGEEIVTSDLDLRSAQRGTLTLSTRSWRLHLLTVAVDLIREGISGRLTAIQDGKYTHIAIFPDPKLGARKLGHPANVQHDALSAALRGKTGSADAIDVGCEMTDGAGVALTWYSPNSRLGSPGPSAQEHCGDHRNGPSKVQACCCIGKTRGSLEVFLVHPRRPVLGQPRTMGHGLSPKVNLTEGRGPARRPPSESFARKRPIRRGANFKPLKPIRQRGGKNRLRVGQCTMTWSRQPTNRATPFRWKWPRGSGKMREFPEIDRAEWFKIDLAATQKS